MPSVGWIDIGTCGCHRHPNAPVRLVSRPALHAAYPCHGTALRYDETEVPVLDRRCRADRADFGLRPGPPREPSTPYRGRFTGFGCGASATRPCGKAPRGTRAFPAASTAMPAPSPAGGVASTRIRRSRCFAKGRDHRLGPALSRFWGPLHNVSCRTPKPGCRCHFRLQRRYRTSGSSHSGPRPGTR